MREETIEKPNEYHIAEAVVVPVDDVMEICPGDGELLTFELDGETKTFPNAGPTNALGTAATSAS